jgi:uroporphyrin-III C-methyltransferase/precorrin-2 dehydrogenase/sirohydrochlorin ferrochelatase
MAHGRAADTPVALISAGTTDAQTVVECPLADAGKIARELPGPLLTVIGDVVRLRDRLQWREMLSSEARHRNRRAQARVPVP